VGSEAGDEKNFDFEQGFRGEGEIAKAEGEIGFPPSGAEQARSAFMGKVGKGHERRRNGSREGFGWGKIVSRRGELKRKKQKTGKKIYHQATQRERTNIPREISAEFRAVISKRRKTSVRGQRNTNEDQRGNLIYKRNFLHLV